MYGEFEELYPALDVQRELTTIKVKMGLKVISLVVQCLKVYWTLTSFDAFFALAMLGTLQSYVKPFTLDQ